MNKALNKICIIESETLNSEFYFQSLAEQAHDKGLLNDSEIERLQYDCLALLAKKAEKYNSGYSSSLPVEKAQSLMASVLFTIGVHLKTFPSPDDAVMALKNNSVDDLYQQGLERIDKLLTSSKTLHKNLLKHLADIKNVFYTSTIDGGIKGFFKLYDADYSAQEIHITADYPVCFPVPKLAGIEFITTYLNRLYLENSFLGYFTPEDIHHLLCGGFGEYEELLINVFEPVLTAAIGCALTGADPRRLDISAGNASLPPFENCSEKEILALIQTSAQKLNRIFDFSPQLYRYIKSCLPPIARTIQAAVDKKRLDKVFFNPDYPEDRPQITYSFGEKMDDEQYRKVLDEIAVCRSLKKKIAVIKEQIHSLADLEDVLLDAEWTRGEICEILGGLGLPELAAFSKQYQLHTETDDFELREREQDLRKCLKETITKLPQKLQEAIEQMAKSFR